MSGITNQKDVTKVSYSDQQFARRATLKFLNVLQEGQVGIRPLLAPYTGTNPEGYVAGTMLARYSAAHPTYPDMLVNFDPTSADVGQADWATHKFVLADTTIRNEDISAASVLGGYARNLASVAIGGEFYIDKMYASLASQLDVVTELAASGIKMLNNIAYIND